APPAGAHREAAGARPVLVARLHGRRGSAGSTPHRARAAGRVRAALRERDPDLGARDPRRRGLAVAGPAASGVLAAGRRGPGHARRLAARALPGAAALARPARRGRGAAPRPPARGRSGAGVTSVSVVTIPDRGRARHLAAATEKLLAFPYRAPKAAAPPAQATLGGRRVAYRPLQGAAPATPAAEEFRIADRIRDIAPDDDLFTDVEHHVLRTIRRGVQVYLQIHEAYERASGLDRLKAANQAGELPARDEAELAEKIEAASAAAAFALCAYVPTQLRDYQRDATERLAFEVEEPTEVQLVGKLDALHAVLFFLWRAIDGHARDDAAVVKGGGDAARAYAP